MNPGSSAGCFSRGRRGVLEMGRRGGNRKIVELAFGSVHLGIALPIDLLCVCNDCRRQADALLVAMVFPGEKFVA